MWEAPVESCSAPSRSQEGFQDSREDRQRGKATGRRWDQRDAGHGDEQKSKEGEAQEGQSEKGQNAQEKEEAGRVLKTSERCGKAHFLFSVSVLAFLNCFCFLLPGDLQHVL